MSPKRELVDLTGRVYAETAKAILFSTTGDAKDAKWLPRSLIEIEHDAPKNVYIVTMPSWVAVDKGLV